MGSTRSLLGRGPAVLLASFLALGCSAKGVSDGYEPEFAAPGAADAGPDASVIAAGFGDASAVDMPKEGARTIFYAHDNASLYRVDAEDPKLALTKLGKFDCIRSGSASDGEPPPGTDTSMTDIAIDRTGKLYGIGPRMIFRDMTLEADRVACLGKGTEFAGASKSVKFFGASFAPVGTVDPNGEALVVGNTDGDLYAIDLVTGVSVPLGTLGTVPATDGRGHSYAHRGKTWELSGDLVFLANEGKPIGFATVRDCPNPPSTAGCNDVDTLVELDMSKLRPNNTGVVVKSKVRGQIVKGAGCSDIANAGYGGMFGIAAYKGDIFGFSNSGVVVRIDNDKGVACRIADRDSIRFAGAGVTTVAPVIAPPR